jgi:hypothetical protein
MQAFEQVFRVRLILRDAGMDAVTDSGTRTNLQP